MHELGNCSFTESWLCQDEKERERKSADLVIDSGNDLINSNKKRDTLPETMVRGGLGKKEKKQQPVKL